MPHYTTTDGVSLFYELRGTGPNEIIFLHGMGSSAIWTPVLPLIDLSTTRVLTIDFRGHGRSGGRPDDFTYAQLEQDILAVAERASFRRSLVAAYSGGCKNAVRLAAKWPDRVRGLLLVGPPGLGVVPVPPEEIALFLDSIERERDWPASFADWCTEKLGARRSHSVAAIVATPRAFLEASVRTWIETPVLEHATRVSQPVLVVAGSREPIYHPAFQRETTLAVLPHAEMEVLDCGHFIPCEEPALLAALINHFTARSRDQAAVG